MLRVDFCDGGTGTSADALVSRLLVRFSSLAFFLLISPLLLASLIVVVVHPSCEFNGEQARQVVFFFIYLVTLCGGGVDRKSCIADTDSTRCFVDEHSEAAVMESYIGHA